MYFGSFVVFRDCVVKDNLLHMSAIVLLLLLQEDLLELQDQNLAATMKEQQHRALEFWEKNWVRNDLYSSIIYVEGSHGPSNMFLYSTLVSTLLLLLR